MKNKIFVLVSAIVVLYGCKNLFHKSEAEKIVEISLEPKSNSNVSGKAIFKEHNGVVTFTANISGLEPGIHAIHIHEKSDCSANDASSAGGHWNPTFKKHGKWGSNEYHKGDIGNIIADNKGDASITLSTAEWCIGCEDETKNILNKSLIVHKDADDYTTQPTGNAGGRVACSAIIK